MSVECDICKSTTESKNIFTEAERPDNVTYRIEVYCPGHNIDVTIGNILHRFSENEIALIGRENYSDALKRISSACEEVQSFDRKAMYYFIDQKNQREEIYAHIRQSYQQEKEIEFS